MPVDLLHRGLQQDPRRPNNKEGGDSTLELGELEQLCVNNDAEISYDVSFKNFFLHFELNRFFSDVSYNSLMSSMYHLL